MKLLPNSLTIIWLILLSTFAKAQSNDPATSQDFSLEILGDQRTFLQAGLLPSQVRNYTSFAVKPTYALEWADGSQAIQFTGFARWESGDTRRTHWDIRELYWQFVKNDWEFSLGVKKVFWGVTESAHLVDIINQTDFVESFDGEEKLGQPMAHYSISSGIGTIDLFAMPYFRKRQFAGEEGRFQTPFSLDKSQVGFEKSAEEWHPSFAIRWAQSFGQLELGLSHFYGTGREPVIRFDESDLGFTAIYPLINQTGIDVQIITGPVLWKFESIIRRSQPQNMWAFAAGAEYTISNTLNTGMDIGLLAEYLFDDRNELALSGLDNDLFLGTRLAFNDVQGTQVLVGAIFDLERSTQLFSMEASRRIANNWKIELEARILDQISDKEFMHFFRKDSFLQLRFVKFF